MKKDFEFNTYFEGIEFAYKVGEIAEKRNHHPEILIEYRKVTVTSTTHSSGNTITFQDTELADEINSLFENDH